MDAPRYATANALATLSHVHVHMGGNHRAGLKFTAPELTLIVA